MMKSNKPIVTPQQTSEIQAGAIGFNAGIRAAEARFKRETDKLKGDTVPVLISQPKKRNRRPDAVDDRS